MELDFDDIIKTQTEAAQDAFHEADLAELDTGMCWKLAMEAAFKALQKKLPHTSYQFYPGHVNVAKGLKLYKQLRVLGKDKNTP